jgi:hypothetical protein
MKKSVFIATAALTTTFCLTVAAASSSLMAGRAGHADAYASYSGNATQAANVAVIPEPIGVVEGRVGDFYFRYNVLSLDQYVVYRPPVEQSAALASVAPTDVLFDAPAKGKM